MGGELRSPEEFPHGNLKHTSVAKKQAPKNAELGGDKKTRNSIAILQHLKMKICKKWKNENEETGGDKQGWMQKTKKAHKSPWHGELGHTFQNLITM